MKARRKKLASAIQIAVLLAIPAVAVAQEATTLDTVTVTGSRIKQTNAVTAQPVYVLDRQKIEQTGVQSVGEILQQLTAGPSRWHATTATQPATRYQRRTPVVTYCPTTATWTAVTA